MLAREDRCISLLSSLFMGRGFGNVLSSEEQIWDLDAINCIE
jgi:hypothetical protein